MYREFESLRIQQVDNAALLPTSVTAGRSKVGEADIASPHIVLFAGGGGAGIGFLIVAIRQDDIENSIASKPSPAQTASPPASFDGNSVG